jgi:hypothetical protein
MTFDNFSFIRQLNFFCIAYQGFLINTAIFFHSLSNKRGTFLYYVTSLTINFFLLFLRPPTNQQTTQQSNHHHQKRPTVNNTAHSGKRIRLAIPLSIFAKPSA